MTYRLAIIWDVHAALQGRRAGADPSNPPRRRARAFRETMGSMARMRQCKLRGKTIAIEEALELRDRRDERAFDCLYCGHRVAPHVSGSDGEPHFEHHPANAKCPRPR